MFRIELDSLKAALVRKAPTRKKYTPRRRVIERVAKRLGVTLAAGAALAVVIAANPVAPSANAATIRSSAGSDACTIDVGTAGNASITKNGDYCIVRVTGNTTLTFPHYTSNMSVILVGGGGGGGTDGGTGGSGGAVRYQSGQTVTAGATATVTIGAGGLGGVWGGGGRAASGGNPSSITGAGLDFYANGGNAGAGWNSCNYQAGPAGGTGLRGGTNAAGGNGGNGLSSCPTAGNLTVGSAGSDGPSISVTAVAAANYAGGGGAGNCLASPTYNHPGAAGGAGGGGRGANFTVGSGASAGVAGTANTGGGGGAGSACDWSGGTNGVNQRTAGGDGGSGVAIFSFIENKMAVTQAPNGCVTNVAEGCLVPAIVQLQDINGTNLSNSGVNVTVTSSSGTAAGTTTVATNSSGAATFSNLYLTGATVGGTATLTFEAVGYRNIQTTITVYQYADTLNVVSGSTDTAGTFLGSTGVWLATASTSNVSVTTLQNQLALRDVTLRAHSATNSLGNIDINAAANVQSTAAATRTLNLKASRNVLVNSGSRVASTTQPLNVIITTNTDSSAGGMVWIGGSTTNYAFDTNGGHFVIGGSSSTTTWNGLTVPSGHATGVRDTTGSWWGIEFATNTNTANLLLIRTSGGDMRLFGAADAGSTTLPTALYGIAWESGRVDLGSGNLTMNGLTFGSPSPASGDNWAVGIGVNNGSTNDKPVLVTTGTATATGSVGTPGSSNFWSAAIGYSDITTGSGGFNVSASQRAIAWNGNTFRSPLNMTSNTVQLTGSNTLQDTVALTASAGDVVVGGNQTITGSRKSLIAKATGDVDTPPSSVIQTNGGDIVFWANTDKVSGNNNNSGRVFLDTNTTLRSQGGKIWLAGGLDDGGADASITAAKGAFDTVAAGDGLPDGYGIGTAVSGETAGAHLGKGYLISSAGGDIFIAGMNAPASGGGTIATVMMTEGLIDSGAGRIGIWGRSQANGDANSGIVLHMTDNTADTTVYSANRTAKAITIYGDSSPSTNVYSDGITAWGWAPWVANSRWGYNSTHLIASGTKNPADSTNFPGGGITVVGLGTSNTSANGGHGIVWQWADIIAKDGPITMTGVDSDSSNYDSAGIYVGQDNASTYMRFGAWTTFSNQTLNTWTDQAGNVIDLSTSSSDITLNASRFVFIEYANGAVVEGYRFKTTGDLTMQSTGASFANPMDQTHWQFARINISGNPRNVTIGKAGNTAKVNWFYDINATGTITFNTGQLWVSSTIDLITTASSGTGIVINAANNTAEWASTNILQTSGASIQITADFVLFYGSSRVVTTAATGQGIVMKANSRMYGGTSFLAQTSGADITLWTDPDNDGVGAYFFEAGSQIRSAGGRITIAGGLDDGATNFPEILGRTAGDGYPDNYAGGMSGWGTNAGIDMLSTAQVISGGGDIFMAGRGSATAGDDDYGIRFRGGMVYSGGGKIAMYGKSPASCANNWHRVLSFAWDSGQSTNIISESTAADAIYLRGEASSCNNGGNVYAAAIASYHATNIAAPNGGGVKLYGSMGSASFAGGTWGNDYQPSAILELNYTHILANTGKIDLIAERTSGSGNHEIRFNSRGGTAEDSIGFHTADISTGVAAYPTISVRSSTSDITITGDSFVADYARPRTTGNLVIEPFKSSFWTDQYYTTDWRAAFPTTYASVRIGKSGTNGSNQNTSNIFVDGIASSGPVSIYGQNLEVRNGITTSATSGAGILLKAREDITFTAGTSATPKVISVTGTNSTAPINVWANADATGEGYIYVNNYNHFTTQGGAVTIGGSSAATSSNPDGYAVSTTAGVAGIRLGGSHGVSNANVRLTSNGGDITLRGKSTAGGSWGMLTYGGLNINSGSGRILMDGYAVGSGNGFDFEQTASNLSTITSAAPAGATPAVLISGKCDSTANGDAGQRAIYTGGTGLTISATGGGNVSLFGDNAAVQATNPGSIYLTGVDVLASTGSITIDGGTDGVVTSIASTTSNLGATGSGTATGNVSVIGDRLTSAGTTNVKTTGNVTLESAGSTFVSAASLGGFNVASGAANFRLGKTTNASTVTTTGSISVTGSIEVYGDGFNLGSFTTTATSGTGILLKSMSWITINAGTSGARTQIAVTGTNSTAPITLWANSDAVGTGNIQIGAYTDVTSRAGAITIAGSATASETSPTGYAVGSLYGVDIGVSATATDSVRISSTSGDITIRGRSNNANSTSASAIQLWSGNSITSTTGAILLDGYSFRPQTSGGHAVEIGKTGGFTTTISTGDPSGDAITISGIVETGPESNTNANGIILGLASTGTINVNATGGGNISLTGVASASTTDSIEVNRANVYATSGNITINGGTQRVAFGDNGVNTLGGAVAAADHTGSINICGGSVAFVTQLTTIRNTGSTIIEPCSTATSFTSAQTWGSSAVSLNTGSFRFGKTGNNVAMTVAGAITTSAGSAIIHGSDLTINSGISVSGASSAILLRSLGNITTAASLTFSTAGGDVTFWADADANGAGRIALANTNTITTTGGRVTLAGGSDDGASTVTSGRTANDGYPDGWAAGNGSTSSCTAATGTLQGVFLSTTTTISSGNGDVFIAGRGLTGATGNCASGVIANQDLWITAGSGKVAIYGTANAAAGSVYSSGIVLYGNSSRKTIISSSNSANDSILLSGVAGPTASQRSSGIFIHGQTAGANVNTIFANTGTGGISMIARSTPTVVETLADNVGDALELYGFAALAKSGPISLTGVTGAASNSNRYGCAFDHSTASSLSPSQISFGARASTTVAGVDMSSSTSNILLNCDSLIVGNTTQPKQFLTTGTVTIQPADGAQSFDRSIDTTGLTFGSGVSSLTIGQSGTGGVASGSTQNNADVAISNSVSIAGPISVFGGEVSTSVNLTSTLLDAPILLKATGSITQNASTTIRTNSGRAILWADADSNAGGMVIVRGSLCTAPTATTCDVNAATGGDDIIIGGAAADSVDATIPAGFATGTGTATQNVTTGVQLGTMGTANTGAKLYSSGGNITINGQSVVTAANVTANSFGIMLVSGTDLIAGGGKIRLNGRNAITSWTGVNVNGIEVNGWGGGSTRLNTTNSADDAIYISTPSVTTGNGFASYNGGTEFNNANGGILIQTPSWTTGATANQYRWNVGGPLIIEPTVTSFSVPLAFDTNNVFGSNLPTTFRIGKDGNTSNITISTPVTAKTSIEAYGNNVSASANLTVSTSTTGGIMLKGRQDVWMNGGASAAARNTMQTNGGPITMWSNSDFSGTGAILLGNFTRLLSNGGAITMAGSASASETSPTGYARNNATVFPNGVELGTSNVASNVEINSSGGDITIRGYSNSNVNLTMGVKGWAGNTITAGTGSITVDGQVDGATGAITLHGTEFGFNGGATTSITSTKTSGTAISISGNSVGGTSSDTTGFTLWNPVTINASGGGDIVLNASSASANTPAAMRITGATILGKGAITFNGGKRVIFGANNVGTANTIGASTLATDAPGNVTVSSDFVEFINVVTTFRNSGNLVIEPASASFSAAQTLPASQFVETGVNGLRWGKSGNTAALTVSTALTAAGNIELYGGATTVSSAITSTGGTILSNASTFSNTATLTTTGRNISVFADQATIGAALTTGSTSGGIVTLSPSSVARNVDLGAADSASLLGLTDAELDFVTAQTLRVGSSSFANNVNISGAISIASNRVTNLAVRAAGDITTSGSGSLAVTNFGAQAGGVITIGGANGITGSLALNATGATATFNQTTGSYTPNSVDSIQARFGVVNSIALSQVPTVQVQDAFMAVAFNPPPTVTLKDEYGNNLASTNSLSGSYAVVAAIASSSNTTGTPALSGTTRRTTTAGSATFSDLNVTGGTGTVTLSFTPVLASDVTNASVATAQTTGSYNVQAGDPSALTIATAPAGGRSGLAFTTQPVINIRDVGGNLVQTSPGNQLAVTASLTGGTGSLVGATTVNAVNSVATFTNLGISGLVSDTYEITFTATFNGTNLTVAQSSITITHGNASQLSIVTPAAGAASGAAFTTQPVVRVLDAQGNLVANSGVTITASTTSTNATLGGTLTQAAVNGEATFSNLAFTGTVGTQLLNFDATGLTGTGQNVTLVNGAIDRIAVTVSSTATVDVAFAQQPEVTFYDSANNVVTTGTGSNATVTLSSTGLTGTATLAATNGVATFSGLKFVTTVGTKTLTASISSPVSKTATASITLSAGAPTQLGTFQALDATTNRTNFVAQPIIDILDVAGNRTTSTANVTATITSTGGSIALGGTTTVAAVNGRATFTNLQPQGKVGTITVSFASTGLTGVSQQDTLAHGASSSLIVRIGNTSQTNAVAWQGSLSVGILDQDANSVTTGADATASVVLSSSTLASLTPANKLTKPAVAGDATFTGDGITAVGTAGSNTITATVTTADSRTLTADGSFTLAVGAATKLAIITPAAGAASGAAWTTQPLIEVQDSGNNRVNSSTATIAIGTDLGTLSGNTSVAATSGRVSFSGVSLAATAGTRTITYSSTGLTSATQNLLLTFGAASKLALTTPVAGFVNRTNFTTQPVVEIQDAEGNRVTSATDTVTVAIDSGNLTGTVTANASAGVATFSGLGKNGLVGLTFCWGIIFCTGQELANNFFPTPATP